MQSLLDLLAAYAILLKWSIDCSSDIILPTFICNYMAIRQQIGCQDNECYDDTENNLLSAMSIAPLMTMLQNETMRDGVNKVQWLVSELNWLTIERCTLVSCPTGVVTEFVANLAMVVAWRGSPDTRTQFNSLVPSSSAFNIFGRFLDNLLPVDQACVREIPFPLCAVARLLSLKFLQINANSFIG